MRCAFYLLLVMLLVGWIVVATPALSGEIEGVPFADQVRLGDDGDAERPELALRSMGLLRYRVVFRGYVAALYLPKDVPTERVLDDVPRRLELSYFWSIRGKDFGGAAEQKLEETLDPRSRAAIRERVETLHRTYRDVSPGDRYALDYIPGEGTTLRLNGEPLVTIPGADFARAYFGLWLGEDPLDDTLRDRLLEN